MKAHKINTLVILLIISIVPSFSQNQQTLYPKGAKWYYNIQQRFDLKNYGYRLYEVTGDSILNTQNAIVVKEEIHQHSGSVEEGETYIFKADSLKVNYWNDGSFQPMYNFGLNTGDTLFKTKYNHEACDSISPYIIDSVLIKDHNGVQLKHQYVSTTLYFKPEWGYQPERIGYELIERIGYANSFIFKPSCFVGDNFGVNNSLRCYIDDELHYQSQWWNFKECDNIITSIHKINHNNSIKITPLVSDHFITFSSDKSSSFKAIIYDMNGKFQTKFTGEFPFQADISGLNPGIYLLRLNTNDAITNHKIIKK